MRTKTLLAMVTYQDVEAQWNGANRSLRSFNYSSMFKCLLAYFCVKVMKL